MFATSLSWLLMPPSPYFESTPLNFFVWLQVNPETGYIDYDRLEENARLFHPKLIIAGEPSFSSTPRGYSEAICLGLGTLPQVVRPLS